MIGLLGIVLIIITIILCIKDVSYGIVVFFVTRILIPESVRIPGGAISLNTAIIFLLFLFSLIKILCVGKMEMNGRFGMALVIFVLYAALALSMADYGSISVQFSTLIKFIITDLTPAYILFLNLKTEKQFNRIIKGLVVISIICCSYGILSAIIGRNVYIEFISNSLDAEVYVRDAVLWSGFETSSTFVSTNSFGYFIVLCLPFFVYLFSKGIYKSETKVAIVLFLINVILCKKRTTFVVCLFYIAMWIISGDIKKRIKLFIYMFAPTIMIIVAIFTLPQLSKLKSFIMISTFFWDDSIYRGVAGMQAGSTWELRTRQFIYPLTEIKSNILFGHGYGWCGWYLATYELHPILFGFETILSQLICDYGIMGYIIYPFVMICSGKFASASKRIKNKYIIMFFASTILLMIGTGAVYWYLFLMIIILMHYCETQDNHKQLDLRSTCLND